MLFMVIERFKGGYPGPVGERFASFGRMLPEGVEYVTSWMEPSGGRCFQVMEAPDASALGEWTRRWDDLVEFEVVPIVTSAEFWAGDDSDGPGLASPAGETGPNA
jgi:hypothetical protein